MRKTGTTSGWWAGLQPSERRGIVRPYLTALISYAILAVCAGSWTLTRVIVLVGLQLTSVVLYTITLLKHNRELLVRRTHINRSDTYPGDLRLLIVWRLLTLSALIVAGLELRQQGMNGVAAWFYPGIVLYMLGVWVISWSILTNTHFETTIRLQQDRDHQVCTSGPYQIVRHPGYVGVLLLTIAEPLILGSWWMVIPNALIAALFLMRTAIEDRFLQEQLDGYLEYTRQVRFRVIPLIW